MAILTGSDAGVTSNSSETLWSGLKQQASNVLTGVESVITSLVSGASNTYTEPVFVDNGLSSVPGTVFPGSTLSGISDFKERHITSQEPVLTVYIHKRAFRSFAAENDVKYMDKGEKLFLRATKTLFENKCMQLASYEALTKARSLLDEETDLDEDRIATVIQYLNTSLQNAVNLAQQNIYDWNQQFASFSSGQTLLPWQIRMQDLQQQLKDAKAMTQSSDSIAAGLKGLKDKVRGMKHATQTTWVVDVNQPDVFLTGRGCGTIELTLIHELNTTLSLDAGSNGSIDFSMQDPYNLTKITSDEIETALSTAQMELNGTLSDAMSPQALYESAMSLEQQLTSTRKSRLATSFATNAFGGVDNSEIMFQINPTTGAANSVVASIGAIPTAFDATNYEIILAQLPLQLQLTSDENNLVATIFQTLGQYVNELQTINNNYATANSSPDVTNARRNLRVHYLGKSIVQPMDLVNVYMRSTTFQQGETVGPLDAALSNTMFARYGAEIQDLSDAELAAEMTIQGLDSLGIPVGLYRQLRTDSLLRNAGMHVFGGLIKTVSESYSDGVYTTRVSGESNMAWLDQSRVNVTPSLDQTQGVLEDPLTAFDIKIDPGSHLIQAATTFPPFNSETQARLNNGLIVYNNGVTPGQPLDQTNFAQDYFDNGDGTYITQFKHAPGLTYKWKQGIISATRSVNLRTTLDGSPDATQRLKREMGLTVMSNPFVGQDAADIVSVLVTGFPHNYESFYKNAKSAGTYSMNNGAVSPESYFHSYFDILRSQNRVFGNFQPYKTIKTDPRALQSRLAAQTSLSTTSQTLNNLIGQKAKLQDQLNSLTTYQNQSLTAGPPTPDNPYAKVSAGLNTLIHDLTKQINDQASAFKNTAAQGQAVGMRLYGSDIAVDYGAPTAESSTAGTQELFGSIKLRDQLTLFRPQYDCKFNSDTNYFIVGDEYDKDLDIQAFALVMSQNTQMWNSDFKSPKEIAVNAAKVLDFELFCDCQGHIQFRPPRFNHTPLSLILKMFLLAKQQSNKLYPDFLSSLFQTTKQNLESQLQENALNIDIEGVLLGMGDPTVVGAQKTTIINSSGSAATALTSKVASTNVGMSASDNLVFNVWSPIDTTDLQSRSDQLLALRATLNSLTSGPAIDVTDVDTREAAEEEILSLNSPTQPNMYSNRVAAVNRLSQLVSSRQRLLDQQTKMAAQGSNADNTPGNISGNMSADMLSYFSDIIEDDLNDTLGPGSARRFIIYDDQIISSTFTESGENVVCRVDVNGEQDLIGEGPGNLGGIPALWAGATDFDLWRQYGYKTDGSVSRPFLKDAETQMAPYAVMLLSRNRKMAVSGSITVAGNEYYQLGDVVYIVSRDSLFYVTTISHGFLYQSGNCTTTLTLQYGHPLGEYIPTPLDVIGKSLIKSHNAINKVGVSRQTTSTTVGRHLASIIFPTSTKHNDLTDALGSAYGRFNLNELQNALMIANDQISPSDMYPQLEIRGFAIFKGDATSVEARMDAVKDWFLNPRGLYSSTGGRFANLTSFFTTKALSIDDISDNDKALVFGTDLKVNNAYQRLPKEEVYSLVDGNSPGGIELIIEVVLIFGAI